MRAHAACTITSAGDAAFAQATPGYRYLNVAPAAPGSNPSVANSGFCADAATGLIPESLTVSAAGVVARASCRDAAGRIILGLEKPVDRTRAVPWVGFFGTNANPPVPARGRTNLGGVQSRIQAVCAAMASASNTAAATNADMNVVLSIYIGTSAGAAGASFNSRVLDDMFFTSGNGLIHVAVFALDEFAI